MEIKEEILDYFKGLNLVILDRKDNKSIKYYTQYYSGVTIPYIYKYVLKEKYPIKEVCKVLVELHTNNELHSLYCGYVRDIVFENIQSMHWNYSKKPSGIVQHLAKTFPKSETTYDYQYFLDKVKIYEEWTEKKEELDLMKESCDGH